MRLSSPLLFAALSTSLLACTSDPGVTVHNADPRAEITSHADGDSPDAGLRGFTGIVEDPDHDAEQLELSWLLDGVEACPPVSPDASGNTSCEIFLESGERTVTLQVMDPLGGLASDKVTLEVQPYGDPWAEISAPEAGGIYYSDQLIDFIGVVGDEADAAADLEAWWESGGEALDVLAEPDSSGNVIGSGYLEQGDHQLVLKVRNSGGNEAFDSVTIQVGAPNSAPNCAITFPEDGASGPFGDPLALTAEVSDPDVPADWLSVSWTSDHDGALGDSSPSSSGEVAFSTTLSSIATHTITMRVEDELGASCSDFVQYTVEDCSETFYADSDGDGYGDPGVTTAGCEAPSGYVADSSDCDDGDAAIHPAATEVCNGIDDDCDGDTDDDDSSLDSSTGSTWYIDSDGDGYGDASGSTQACSQPSGYAADTSDCDDSSASTHPGADEYCDGVDTDCDGTTDEADAIDASSWYADSDGDGYGDPLSTSRACTAPSGYVADSSDCGDSSAAIHPGADEYCDGTDTDCDGALDEAEALDASDWYTDGDGDSYGDPGSSTAACTAPSGHVGDSSDCDDGDSAINPGATESCNGIDDDCDGLVDDDDPGMVGTATWYADSDGDGYGDPLSITHACTAPSGHVADCSDCDDGNAAISPAASEICNSVDDDCDGDIDDDDSGVTGGSSWYLDADGDGYGDASSSVSACDQPSGYVAGSSDCDDGDADVFPGADEYCNGSDDDCDGSVDESDAVDMPVWYLDYDADGYGSMALMRQQCSQPSGFVDNADDCDDTSGTTNPGADEYCDGHDDDCDGDVDEDDAFDATTWYLDSDADGYGDGSATQAACSTPSGYVAAGSDCDDGDAAINPAATETCDTLDNDCDGDIDEDDAVDAVEWFRDADGDGYGDASSTTWACDEPSDYVGDDTDCLDSDASAYPGAEEICLDDVDHDCDGSTQCEFDLDSGFMALTGGITAAAAGGALANAGDVDGDGLDELLVGNFPHTYGSAYDSYVYLVDGPVTASASLPSIATATLSHMSSSAFGTSVDGAGDLNADGFDDIIVGAPSRSSTSQGAAYVWYGPLSGSLTPSTADVALLGDDRYGSGGFDGGTAGQSVRGMGDLDGDGYGDLLVGAPYGFMTLADSTGGAAYLVEGPPSAGYLVDIASTVFYSDNTQEFLGTSVAPAGDLDGDGNTDIIIGARNTRDSSYDAAGAAYLFLGPVPAGEIDADTADAIVTAEATYDSAGRCVDGVGDIDGDGYDDFAVGAPGNDAGGSAAGAAYLIYGGTLWSGSLSSADAKLTGTSEDEQVGYTFSTAGDADGDGLPDLFIGGHDTTTGSGRSAYGAAYLVLGPVTGTHDLADADLVLEGGEYAGYAGYDVLGGVDLDGDGFGELLVGAPGVGSTDAGVVYWINGSEL